MWVSEPTSQLEDDQNACIGDDPLGEIPDETAKHSNLASVVEPQRSSIYGSTAETVEHIFPPTLVRKLCIVSLILFELLVSKELLLNDVLCVQ